MNGYLWLKWLHIVSATVLFGCGIGIAYFKWAADRSGDVRAIRWVNERTVLADWVFTTPAVLVQPISGLALAHLAGFPLAQGWVAWAMGLYILAGLCWLRVLRLQWQMRELSRVADAQQTALPAHYRQLALHWFLLGIPAFVALLLVLLLMVFKPAL